MAGLAAAIVIDRATWDCLGEMQLGFEIRKENDIRGRRNPEDVYVLPLA